MGEQKGATVRVGLERRGRTGEKQVAISHWMDAGLLEPPPKGGFFMVSETERKGEKEGKESLKLRSRLWIISFIPLFIHLLNKLINKYQATYSTGFEQIIPRITTAKELCKTQLDLCRAVHM